LETQERTIDKKLIKASNIEILYRNFWVNILFYIIQKECLTKFRIFKFI
jgi:hypothetical protein